jgi:hypothetical protein
MLLTIYLVGYSLLVLGALVALWQGGVLHQISPLWTITGLAIAIGFGLLLAISSGKPKIPRED